MSFLFNDQYQTRTSSYHSSHTSPEDTFHRSQFNEHSAEIYSNPWRVTEEDNVTYHHQRSSYEVAPQQESYPLTWKNLQGMKLETQKEKWDRIYYWLKQSANAPPPPDSLMKPPPDDWNRKKLVPKSRIAPPTHVPGNCLHQDSRKESKRNSPWEDEIIEVPVPVRSPAWGDKFRKSAGQKRKCDQEEEHMQFSGQHSSWQSTKSFVREDRGVQSSYEEDNLHFTRYEESVYETRTTRRMRLASSEAYGTFSTEAKRQARVDRFHRGLDFLNIKNPAKDELNCTLDEIITERVQSRKKVKANPAHDRMHGSVPSAPLPSSPPRLEMQPYDYGNTRSSARGQRRPIVIDGSNVAYGKTLGKYFDSSGICICMDWFLKRGFTDIVVVVSEHRLRNSGCRNPEPLRKLQRENKLVTCWSRKLPNGRWVTSYDDRMIVEIAHRRGGIIISNDRFRDLQKERPEWTETIGTRVVGFRFMPGKMDEIMFPDDPFGRYGPRLEELLRF